MNEDIKVSVFCLVYNHEKFLKNCLDGIVNQKTNFRYEAIIHDDCSTDNSKKIIEEYYKKYPNIIVPIYESENKYSKGINIGEKIMTPIAKGQYIAYCEGDDYWCDGTKLQKQFDYMEKDKECSLCVHNTIIHDLQGEIQDRNFNNWQEIHQLTENEVFREWKVHTSSYMMRKNFANPPKLEHNKYFGDYKKIAFALYFGKVICLPYVMSVYNYNNENGQVRKYKKQSTKNKIIAEENKVLFLKDYNEYTKYKFNKTVEKEINYIKITLGSFQLKEIKSIQEYNAVKKELLSNPEYSNYYSLSSKAHQLYNKLLLSNYFFFKLLIPLKKLKERKQCYE